MTFYSLLLRSLVLITVLACVSGTAQASVAPGTTSMEIMKLPIGAEGMSMAQAYGATHSMEACLIHPSLLPEFRGVGLQACQAQWIGAIRYHTIGAAWEWGKDGGFGALASYADLGNQNYIPEGWSPGTATGPEFRNDTLLLQMGYGQRIDDFLRVGGAFKVGQENYAGFHNAALAFDAGIGWVDRSSWSFVLTGRNMGPRAGFNLSEDFSLPLCIHLGTSRVFRFELQGIDYNAVTFAADGMYYGSEDRQFAFGLEYRTGYPGAHLAALRMGYSRRTNASALANFTFGGGWTAFIQDWTVGLDYAYAPFDDFGPIHFFTLSMAFDPTTYRFAEPEKMKPGF